MAQLKFTVREAMARAIELARKGMGRVAPNPPVGCVILDAQGHLLAEGYHRGAGQAHAEIEALNQVQDRERLKGAHFVVTLEPCAHQGRTPSCAKALAQLPIRQVTYGLVDPNPLVSGKGATILEQAGIKAETCEELRAELEELVEIFLWNQQHQAPFVALKVATSLDGQMALKDGRSQWITGEAARDQAGFLRGTYDAVVVGAQTVLKDNPRLNSRHPMFASQPNKVLVLDAQGQTADFLRNSNLLKVRPADHVSVLTQASHRFSGLTGVTVQHVSGTNGEFNLDEILSWSWKAGLTSLWVEGGAYTLSRFLKLNKAQRLYLYLAPRILGAAGGLAWTQDFAAGAIEEAPSLKKRRVEVYGEDLLITGRL